MRPEERDALLREDVARVETPRHRRQLEGLVEDVLSSPLRGKELSSRLRNFRPDAGGYLTSLGGPLPFMLRLREIDERTVEHERALATAWDELLQSEPEEEAFAAGWRERLERWSFDEVNDLIDRHNRWYPVESRLPMDPRRGDFVLVNGRDYRRRHLDVAWALDRFPAVSPVAVL